MPAVSIIVPSYNAERYIRETLESIRAQTLNDFEVIIVDDGSTDDTFGIAKEYEREDPRISVIHQDNSFAGVARNNGMARATGEYLYFLDSDDFIDHTFLEDMLDAARSCNADVVVCRSRKLSIKTGKIVSNRTAVRDLTFDSPLSQQDVAKTLFRSVVGWPWDKLFKRSFIEQHQLQYQPLRSTNDAYFVFIAMALADTIYCLSKELVTHRIDDMNSVSNTRCKSWNNAIVAMASIKERLQQEGIYPLFERTYVNWCVNFVHWNADTLEDAPARSLIAAARNQLGSLPTNPDFYFEERDAEFAKIIQANRDELALCATRQLDELRTARRIYRLGPYKILVRLIKPIHLIRNRLL